MCCSPIRKPARRSQPIDSFMELIWLNRSVDPDRPHSDIRNIMCLNAFLYVSTGFYVFLFVSAFVFGVEVGSDFPF